MLIGVISDTHLETGDELPPLDEYFKDVSMILHAGDLVSLSVLKQLSRYSDKVIAVAGNMDSEEVKAVLPEKRVIRVAGFKIGLIHGWGPPAEIAKRVSREFPKDIDVIVFGHSHQPVCETVKGVLYLNPGSPNDSLFAKTNSVGLIELDGRPKGRLIKL